MHAEATDRNIHAVKSMTGFGRGQASSGDVEVAAEVKSVNHRYLDVSVRLPRLYSSFEPQVRKIVSEHIGRGKVDVAIVRSGTSGAIMDVTLDMELARKYHERLSELKKRFELAGDVSVSDMLTLKEIVAPVEKGEEVDREFRLLEESLRQALEALDGMRRIEGAALWADMKPRVIGLRETANRIGPLAHQVTIVAKERLEKRTKELMGGLELDPDRLMQEVALIAERADVIEELKRLDSHAEQFLGSVEQGSPLGRKLDFLLQEMNREINTIGSKSSSSDIASLVVLMKSEVEKVREQTQNIE